VSFSFDLEASMTLPATHSLEAAAVRVWDAIVVGAGPAGAVATRELAQRGLTVLLVDKATFPRWKVCGACLSARALDLLASIGLSTLITGGGAVPLTHVRLTAGGRSAVLRLPGGAALSRETFDAALIQVAMEAGAAFLPATYATLAPGSDAGRTLYLRQGRREVRADSRLVIAADGLGGRLLAGEPGFQTESAPAARIGAGTLAREAPEFYRSGTIFMTCGPGGYVGLVRLEDSRLDIAAAFDRAWLRKAGGPGVAAARLLAEAGWPAVPRLQALAWRGTMALTRRPRRLAGERLFVLGDAAGYVEPFTGEGIAWALAAAVAVAPLAVRAVQGWVPALARRWPRLYRAAVGGQGACRIIAKLLRHPRLATGLVGVLGEFPSLGNPFLYHLNARPAERAVPL
jgi:flavin-dependent dehydrogenase